MAIKEYLAIDPTTNLVVLLTSCEEADVATLYPTLTMIETPPTQSHVRKPYPGMLYSRGVFWSQPGINESSAFKASSVTRWGFRRLFTNEELVKADNFALDISLPVTDRAQLNTFTISMGLNAVVGLSDALTADYVGALVVAGYLTEERKTAILAGTAP